MQIKMALKNDTKNCHRFEHKNKDGTFITLYLKKSDVAEAGINPGKGIVINIEEDKTNV